MSRHIKYCSDFIMSDLNFGPPSIISRICIIHLREETARTVRLTCVFRAVSLLTGFQVESQQTLIIAHHVLLTCRQNVQKWKFSRCCKNIHLISFKLNDNLSLFLPGHKNFCHTTYTTRVCLVGYTMGTGFFTGLHDEVEVVWPCPVSWWHVAVARHLC